MKKVKMYTLSYCPWCMKTKEFFKANKIAFEFVDYDLASEEEQQKIQADIERLGGDGGFPFVMIDKIVIQGYNPDEYKKALGIK